MVFLQTRFYDKTKSQLLKNPQKNRKGFMTVSLLVFLSLIITVIIGFSLMSVGIKNITHSQSLCIKGLIQTQKELKPFLKKLLALNNRVKQLHYSRQAIDVAIASALASVVLIPKVPKLKKIRDTIKKQQKTLRLQQELLLKKAFLSKTKNLNQLKQKLKAKKAFQIKNHSFIKKALAVKKEKLGQQAFIYKPVENFKQQQKIRLSWKLNPFGRLHPDRKFLLIEGSASQRLSCTATLQKKGGRWISRLYH